ncbi:uncharacterized protein DUF2381 [Archangium gephyra]|uniref:Uncharacterized protein DUF2381 n=1 Tax=Archangium gephyra TaxID=48 RepID=A0AAC8TC03_9BACT|nr:DUF2381 family protein [Archangium gephyra]AKI98950.1 Hypothetical protein AA314_00577 [Archangium gephyra]REG30860.1 uncharacterized protein DUF2381 [Archangium gephyra]
MRPRPWSVLLWVLLLSTAAMAREARQGTVLVAGHPGAAPPVLYVAARVSTLVDFEGLLEPRVALTPELGERLAVLPVGARSLVVVPVRDLARGERMLLPVTGRTEAGEPRAVTLALVTREDEVDVQVQVSLGTREPRVLEASAEGGVGTVAGMLLASHEPGASPGLSLVMPAEGLMRTQAGEVEGRLESVLQMDRGRLFVTVTVRFTTRPLRPWRLGRARVEAGCWKERARADVALPVVVTSAISGPRVQRHTLAIRLPEGAGCLSLTLEEDGPRTLHLQDWRLPP